MTHDYTLEPAVYWPLRAALTDADLVSAQIEILQAKLQFAQARRTDALRLALPDQAPEAVQSLSWRDDGCQVTIVTLDA